MTQLEFGLFLLVTCGTRGTLVLSKGTLILLNRNSYYQKGTHQKGTLVLSKGTLILLNRNSYYQKGTHQKGTLIMKIGTLILSKRNSSKRNTRIIKRNTHIK